MPMNGTTRHGSADAVVAAVTVVAFVAFGFGRAHAALVVVWKSSTMARAVAIAPTRRRCGTTCFRTEPRRRKITSR